MGCTIPKAGAIEAYSIVISFSASIEPTVSAAVAAMLVLVLLVVVGSSLVAWSGSDPGLGISFVLVMTLIGVGLAVPG